MTEKATKPLVIFGVNPVLEKLKSSPQQVSEILIVKGGASARLNAVIEEARRLGLPVHHVDMRRLNLLAEGGTHQGVAANTEAYVYQPFTDLIEGFGSVDRELLLILDGLTDPRNFGALLRCADAAGVRHVVIPKDRAVGVTPVVVKSSAGAVNYLKIYRVSNLSRAIEALKKSGCWVVGLDPEAAESIYDRAYPEKIAVVLGSEGTGLRPLIRRQCDFLASIPMLGKVASLNVAVAGGICLFEMARQRKG